MPVATKTTRLTFTNTGDFSVVESGEPVKVVSLLFNSIAFLGFSTYTLKTADESVVLGVFRILGQAGSIDAGRCEIAIPFIADAGIGVELTALSAGSASDREVLVTHHQPGT